MFGVGLHTGKPVEVTLSRGNNGITFNSVRVSHNTVNGLPLCTQIGNVSTIEHLMSALWYRNVTNVDITVSGDELPILDGSSKQWVDALDALGGYDTNTKYLKIIKEKNVSVDDKMITVVPSEKFGVKFAFQHNEYTQLYQYENYEDIYSARTFCFKKDIDALLSNGYGKSSNQNNTLILNDDLTPLNSDDNQEFIKHKVLDFIGDMYGSGYRIVGDFYCYKSGHFINNIMLKAILNDKTCYEIVEI